eukprot:COSAG06_NODE_1368_length_9679_cov_3.238055_5_plen_148_part_00
MGTARNKMCSLQDFVFDEPKGLVPKATALDIHSNDHYILNTIVFSSFVGLKMGGAANMISGLHVWFPENRALSFGATAFLDTGGAGGGKNRYDGCYIDASVAVFIEPNEISWLGACVSNQITSRHVTSHRTMYNDQSLWFPARWGEP